MSILKVKKLCPEARLPERATEGSAGYDLYALLDQPLTICPGELVRVHTGIAIALEDRFQVALVYARSGLASRHGVIPANCVGVIDSDYRGEIMVSLANIGTEAYTIEPMERIAQMVIAPVLLPSLQEVEDLDETQRGSGGFGSTGK